MTNPPLSLTTAFAGFGLTSIDDNNYGRDDNGFTVTRGTSSIVSTGFVADAGTHDTTIDNTDRTFDPNNLAGVYVTSGISAVVPGVPISAHAVWAPGTTDYTLFTGRADAWPQTYPLNGADQTIDLHSTDVTSQFANASLAIKRPAEISGARINAVIAAIGYAGPTAIATGNCIVGPLNNTSVSAWSHMQDVANAEWGDLYVANDGTLTFRSRDQIASESRSSSSQATFEQSAGLNFSNVTMGSPPIVNDCTITYDDFGHTVNAQDAASIAAPWSNGTPRSLSLSLPIHTRSQAQQYANWIVARYKTPITTFASITLTPTNEIGDGNPDLWQQALSRELSDLITVVLDPLAVLPDGTPAPSDGPITRDCWIRGIQHNFASLPWSTTFYLQDASWLANLAHYDVNTYDDGSIYSL